jgi:dTDP-4-amino-4,6-dideoxygalactose transaminase
MTQKRDIPFGRPWITDADREAVLQVLSGNVLTHGPECKAFEIEFGAFLGPGAHCISVSSCMAALHLAYLQLGIGEGDEVIVPALTHVATAHAVEWVKARPIFVDCEPATGNISPKAIEAAVTPRTKAIGLVHFVGIPCHMPDILAVAEKHRLKVVEDCAIALGTRWGSTHVGLFGDAGCFSFYPVKHITTAEGGMLATRHESLAPAVGHLRAFGVDRTQAPRRIPGSYEVTRIGLNYRLSELQAALGRTQMHRIDENLRRRRENFEILREGLKGLPVRVLDAQSPEAQSSHYCLVAVLEDAVAAKRDAIVGKLNAAGIGTSVYYPQPVPRMKCYKDKYGYEAARFPNASRVSDAGIALPVAWHVSPDDARFIARTFQQIVDQEKA